MNQQKVEALKGRRLKPSNSPPPAPPDPRTKNENNITLTAREILEKKINEAVANYPTALKAKHLPQIMNCHKPEVYRLLEKGRVPGAKKLPGLGWRIPTLPFFAWFYGNRKDEQNG